MRLELLICAYVASIHACMYRAQSVCKVGVARQKLHVAAFYKNSIVLKCLENCEGYVKMRVNIHVNKYVNAQPQPENNSNNCQHICTHICTYIHKM